MKLLVVEDEPGAARFLAKGLTEEGFAVDVAGTGPAADEAVAVSDYDLVILDVMLPGTNGVTLCRRWRAGGFAAPILFLTARDSVSSRVEGLRAGGDDYLVKPFAFEELLARVHALLRRPRLAPPAEVLKLADLELDTGRHRVTRAGTPVLLSRKEFQLLEHLLRNAGRIISRTELWEHVWASDDVPDSNVVDVYVRYLRNKLGRDPDLIQTIRGAGYLMDRDPQVDAP